MSGRSFILSLGALALAILLAACQTFSPDGGMWLPAAIAEKSLNKDVISIASEDDAAEARRRVEKLLRRSLTADAAVQVALLNNRGLQAAYNSLGIADAVRVPVIASGGVGTLDHLVEGIRDGHATAVLAASIFHFGEFTIGQAKAHVAAAGLAVRLGSRKSEDRSQKEIII